MILSSQFNSSFNAAAMMRAMQAASDAPPPADAPPPSDAPPAEPPATPPPAEEPPSGDGTTPPPAGDGTTPPPDVPPPADDGGTPPPTEPVPPPEDGGPIVGHPPIKQWTAPPPMTIDPKGVYKAQLATSDGVIGVQLLPSFAPNAVNNFVFLAKEGFYKNTPIHRVVPDFMMQSGDPTGTGLGGPGYNLPDDPLPEGLLAPMEPDPQNPDFKAVRYTTGLLAMANTGRPDTAGSQFFIMTGDTDLPPGYSVFGVVTSGVEALEKINAREVVEQEPAPGDEHGEKSKPAEPIGISDIVIEGPPPVEPPPTEPPVEPAPPTEPPVEPAPPVEPPPTTEPPVEPAPPTEPPVEPAPPVEPPPTTEPPVEPAPPTEPPAGQ